MGVTDKDIVDHMPLVKSLVNKYAKGYEREDMIQEGMLALCEARETFDPSLGYKFATYARWKVMGRLKSVRSKHKETVELSDWDGNTSMEKEIHTKLLIDSVKDRMHVLTPKQNEVISMRYMGMSVPTKAEIGRRLGCSRENIGQLEKAAIGRLKDDI